MALLLVFCSQPRDMPPPQLSESDLKLHDSSASMAAQRRKAGIAAQSLMRPAVECGARPVERSTNLALHPRPHVSVLGFHGK
jgi:hypothetical protein